MWCLSIISQTILAELGVAEVVGINTHVFVASQAFENALVKNTAAGVTLNIKFIRYKN